MIISTTQCDRVYDEIAPYLTGCPEAAVRASINSAAEDFVRDIGGVRDLIGPVPFDHEDGVYHLCAPFGGVVLNVNKVLVNGVQANGRDYTVLLDSNGIAVVSFAAKCCNGNFSLAAEIAWRPGHLTKQMPVAWFNKHFTAIQNGALARLFSQVGSAWANEGMATIYAGDYSKDVADALREAKASQGGQLSCFEKNNDWVAGRW